MVAPEVDCKQVGSELSIPCARPIIALASVHSQLSTPLFVDRGSFVEGCAQIPFFVARGSEVFEWCLYFVVFEVAVIYMVYVGSSSSIFPEAIVYRQGYWERVHRWCHYEPLFLYRGSFVKGGACDSLVVAYCFGF